MMTYNLSPEKIILSQEKADQLINLGYKLHEINFIFNNRPIKAWSVKHDNIELNKGLYPIILETLLKKRNQLKSELKTLSKQIEQLEKINNIDNEQYKSLKFQHSYINSKQNALKIYMNSFYGETGNILSPFFIRELAGGVTSAGQYNLKLISEFVKNKGYTIKYGDTDSLYLIIPEEQYK
jgi:DNA polymerase elongation subunit (family B)